MTQTGDPLQAWSAYKLKLSLCLRRTTRQPLPAVDVVSLLVEPIEAVDLRHSAFVDGVRPEVRIGAVAPLPLPLPATEAASRD
jgi:hypothetical protein